MEEGIPSPFSGYRGDPKFMQEIAIICHKYGYEQFFIECSRPTDDGEDSEWFGGSNVISEGMLEYTKQSVEFMEEVIERRQED